MLFSNALLLTETKVRRGIGLLYGGLVEDSGLLECNEDTATAFNGNPVHRGPSTKHDQKNLYYFNTCALHLLLFLL